ncbi:MAG TPA: 50S ribosomal protein L24 [Amaricoccus sp.]|uniref:50S ribosomal protein L24 n=1 Tax=Amaricoccus sp. TaxID=1872485 RepID=UPI002C816AD7|nr:50S ribosomal protein L24 [Amaricoccus sp.]HMQ94260.1 50S ribosomal protein L24 [Amaricoccus sp.]HMR54607.1 50S ribosomal protein L24 [Amaricoccus sp.]HMU01650.1 50S ribosomal protein L24 [Amaricoccus sp.]
MAAKLRKGDKVVVLAGKDKGKQGEIARVMPKDNKAIVSGVNVAIRHQRQTQNAQGGRIAKEMPIDLSNLAFLDPKSGEPTRIGFRMEGDKKVRYAKKSGETIHG